MSTQTQLSAQSIGNENFSTTKDTKDRQGSHPLDDPWKITILPDEPKHAVRLVKAPEEQPARKSLPWKMGDVARLKDDSPEGMMRYIATHTTGWWQEMAERALRDTEKAERMAREAGWQSGQYWSLEVDAEAREKLLAAEEARRQREQAERAKEEAEKEAFARRQMELLEKAGRAPRCEYVYSDGRGCRAPQVKGERWCHGHAKTMSYRPEKLELIPMEDERAVMVNLHRVTASLLSGRITEKTAGLMLWSVAIGMAGARRISPQRTRRTRRKPGFHHGDTETSGDRKGKCKNFETRRKGVTGGQKGKPQMKTEKRRSEQRHAGVTRRKSFKSGMAGRVSPVDLSDTDSRENALEQHGHNRHSRDVSTPPHSSSQAEGRSESLNMTTRRGQRSRSEHREGSITSQTSVSPCLRGGKRTSNHKGQKDREGVGVKCLKSTDLHSNTQAVEDQVNSYNRERSAESQEARGQKLEARS